MSAAALRPSALCASLVLALALVCGGTGPASGDDGWVWPLQPTPPVARPFEPPAEKWSAGHRGVDLTGSAGQPVRAPATGVVRFAGQLAGRGVVVVEVDGLRVTFEPVSSAVDVGDQMAAGQVVGHLQTTQSHCLPAACLHWGVKQGDSYLDPLSFVGDPEIVLLPFLDAADDTADDTAGGGADSWPATRTTPVSTAASPAGSTAGSTAVDFALAQLGEPYVWAAAGPGVWDCSGLTMAAWRAAGRALPHYSAAQYLHTTPVPPERLRPGDLVFWARSSGPAAIFHVALYLGDGQVVHAPRPGTSVRIEGMHAWDSPDYYGRP